DWFVSSIWDTASQPEGNWGSSGNRLYRNDNATFVDATDEAGVRIGWWGWGSSFADFDNDGHLDLFHVNGFIPEAPYFGVDPARFFHNDGDGTFTETATSLGIDDPGQGRGISCFDYDRDGDLDIFIANNKTGPSFYRNDGGNALHWLDVVLDGAGDNSQAVGSRVTITVGGQTQMREIRCGSNFASQDPAEAHFGLGAATIVDEVRVDWLGGGTTILQNVPADQRISILNTVTAVDESPTAESDLRAGSYPEPNPSRSFVRFRIPVGSASFKALDIFDIAGRRVRSIRPPRGAAVPVVEWDGMRQDGTPATAGLYFWKLTSDNRTSTGKVTLVR
ncbi:MAG: T9SS type A sorting domain-containing protein, partial [Gemmatimonadetes bacterium]|nr:T9SS type A sorting domain-containing protein [Gemmatimonadota bacterium]